MCENPEHDHDIPEMNKDEIEQLFMLAGALVMGVHFSFDPSINFDEEAPDEVQELGKMGMMFRTLGIKNQLGDFLDEMLDKQQNSKFEDIIRNLDF